MGAWGVGSFDNDEAADWIGELEQAEDATVLEAAFSQVIDCNGYLEAPECCVGIAAAEIVAALKGKPAAKLPETAREFVKHVSTPASLPLLSSALRALERIKTNSELKELWDESDSRTDWYQAMAELESRLK